MTSLQEVMKWFHEGFRCFLNVDIYIYCILVKEMLFYTGKSPLKAPLSNPVRY